MPALGEILFMASAASCSSPMNVLTQVLTLLMVDAKRS